jgi:hypothetical protein
MAKALTYFAAIGLGLVALFGLFAFVLWEADPSQWTFDSRLFFAGFALIFAWLAAMLLATSRGDIA